MQSVSRDSMIQGAMEELEILEFQHPNKFDTIKLELKSFISELQSQNLLLQSTSVSPCPSAASQESSSRRKRKKSCPVGEMVEESKLGAGTYGGTKRRCKTDAVLERARQCLYKLRHLKTSFF